MKGNSLRLSQFEEADVFLDFVIFMFYILNKTPTLKMCNMLIIPGQRFFLKYALLLSCWLNAGVRDLRPM